MSNPKKSLNIHGFTWKKQLEGLFDYNDPNLTESELSLKSSFIIVRDEEKIKLIPPSNNKNENFEKIGEIEVRQGSYYYIPKEIQIINKTDNISNLSWLVYRGNILPNNNQRYELEIGDVVKIGRVLFLIREINIGKSSFFKENLQINNENIKKIIIPSKSRKITSKKSIKSGISSDLNESDFESKMTLHLSSHAVPLTLNNRALNLKAGSTSKTKQNKSCRICYVGNEEEPEDSDNPLIQPCSCSGSMKYIHINCLRHWLSSKILSNKNRYLPENYCDTYIINKVQCELCQEILPDFINYKGKLLDLLNFQREKNENFIVLDTISNDRKNNRYRHVLRFNEDNIIKIGRGVESHLVVNDITVSRTHSHLVLDKDNRLFIEDQNSKFGTLVLLQTPSLQIIERENLCIQIDRSFLVMEIEKPCFLFRCCCSSHVKEPFKSYQKMNKKFINSWNNTYIKFEIDTSDNEDDNSEIDENGKNSFSGKRNGFLKVIEEESVKQDNTQIEYLANEEKNNEMKVNEGVGRTKTGICEDNKINIGDKKKN